MGKASFCHIQDSEGKIQSYVSINDLGEEDYKAFKEMDILCHSNLLLERTVSLVYMGRK